MMNKKQNYKIICIGDKSDLRPEDYEYDFHPELTAELDAIRGAFDRNVINKIALWKVSRYPYIKDEIIDKLNAIINDQEYEEKHKNLLFLLLDCNGVQLPMASTFLRFRNPRLFQIIDQHVYRLLTGEELILPAYNSAKNKQRICDLYFDYLNKLKSRCHELGIPFEKADRVLYRADKRINKDVKLRNYGS